MEETPCYETLNVEATGMVTIEEEPRKPTEIRMFDTAPSDPGPGGLIITGAETRVCSYWECLESKASTPIGETSNEKSRADVSWVGVAGTTPKIGESPIVIDA